jgi:hypothetical protein
MSDSDYRVGPGRPPKNSQFKKGQSGNRKGRPKGSVNIAALIRRMLRQRVTIQENGRRKVISIAEAIAKRFVNNAMMGDFRALVTVSRLAQSAEDEARKAELEMEETNVQSLSIEQLERIICLGLSPQQRKDVRLE